MLLRDSQTEARRHPGATVSGLGPLAKALIPTPHNSPFLLIRNHPFARGLERSERRRRPERVRSDEQQARTFFVFLAVGMVS